MALQINNQIGFETGGAEELSAVSGSPTYPTGDPAPGGGLRYLDLGAGTGTSVDIPWVLGTDQGDDYVVLVKIKAPDKTPTSNTEFLRVEDSAGSQVLALNLQTNGNVLVLDANDGTIRTIGDPLSTTAYQIWQIHFQHLASAIIEVFINDISQTQDTAQDLTNGNSLDSTAILKLLRPGGLTSPIQMDDILILSGATDASDRFGNFAVKTYQSTDVGDTDQGDALANGTWALVSETPGNSGTSNDAFYENTGNLTGSTITDGGDRPGPSGDSAVTGATIKAAKFIGNFHRTTGGGRTHTLLHGNNVDGVTATADLALNVGYEIREVLSEAAGIVPTASEFFQQGFSKSATAGQDIFCGDQWAMLGYVPAAGAVPVINLVMAPHTPA